LAVLEDHLDVINRTRPDPTAIRLPQSAHAGN
jgi:hypothetical protein